MNSLYYTKNNKHYALQVVFLCMILFNKITRIFVHHTWVRQSPILLYTCPYFPLSVFPVTFRFREGNNGAPSDILFHYKRQHLWLSLITDWSSMSRFRFVRSWTGPRLGQVWDWGFGGGRRAGWGGCFFLDQLWLILPSLGRVHQDLVNNPKVLRLHGTHVPVSLHHTLCVEEMAKLLGKCA